MSWTASSRISTSALLLLSVAGCATDQHRTLLYADDFVTADNWVQEDEKPASVHARDGVMDIDSPAGVTVWFKHRLTGPLSIEFDVTAVAAGGPNDQVSDLNVFWMATNHDGSEPYLAMRHGMFELYNDMLTYYAGLGGNRNTTTRFRRYIGDPNLRPLLPGHDLSASDTLLVPNRKQHITLIADGGHIEYRRDGQVLFTYEDPAPYTSGWFALRTTFSHLRVERLRVHALR